MGSDVVGLEAIDRTQVALAGGKGAHLGELTRVDGVRVPGGVCVTTDAFRRVVAEAPPVDRALGRLAGLGPDDREAIATRSAEARRAIEAVAVPDDLAAAITGAVERLGARDAYAVRSSATAEDSATASFAGQQDTYLNVVGPAAVIEHVRRCWASLCTERAVAYRLRHGIDHRAAQMAVVVQRMVPAQASGVLFTADPVTGNRRVAAVEATVGLGEALVSGLVDPDAYTVRDGEVVTRTIAAKARAVEARPAGGTRHVAVEPGRRRRPALTDPQVVGLVELGRRIEAHMGHPQDVEWCLADGEFHVVQSRPITTLFPVPQCDDGRNHVYVSVGHQQMMTDPLRPLGLSFWKMTAGRPMLDAGGRLFVDVTDALASPATRAGIVEGLGTSDPLIGDALRAVVEREGFLPPPPDEAPGAAPPGRPPAGPPVGGPPAEVEADPAVVTGLIERNAASLATLERAIEGLSGPALMEFVAADVDRWRQSLFDPETLRPILVAMEAARWLNERLEDWLGETNAADTLTLSVPHNVTSEMGLALLDVADAVRPHPEVVAFLESVEDDGFLDRMADLAGGPEARAAIRAFLDRYGMRCVGEIDITRPRWCERPTMLVPLILGNVRNAEPGAGPRRFEQGRQEADRKRRDVLARLRALPDGDRKADETARMIDRVRTFAGYREHPKYAMISRYLVYKQALTAEAERLVRAGVLGAADDVHFLTFPEFHDVVRTHRVDHDLVARRRDEFAAFHALTPPRVLTSEGEAVTGAYRRDDVPAGALVGLAVSSGTVEGRARVVLDMHEADVEPGDILVTAYTDPSWSPLFVAIAGLVTEVGGLMTHGAVVAREYGLPAVVGVEHATRLVRDGQRIRVHGTRGYVELLD